MKYLDKSFQSPANSEAYRDGWEAVFGGDDEIETCLCCGSAQCAGAAKGIRECEQRERPLRCLCEARMAGECMCGAWDD